MLELQLTNISTALEWNHAELKFQLQEFLDRYKDLVITEDNVASMKKTTGEVVSVRTKLDAFRKEVKKRYNEPYLAFEADVKDLLALVDQVERPLKEQLSFYDEMRKEEKMESLRVTLAGIIAEKFPTLRPEYADRIEIEPKLLNLTITEWEINTRLADAALLAFNQQQSADTEAKLKAQRLQLIDAQCAVATVQHGLGLALTREDVQHLILADDDIVEAINKIATQRKLREEAAAQPKTVSAPAPAPAPVSIPTPASIFESEKIFVTLKFELASYEEGVKLRDLLDKHGFTKRTVIN